MKITFENMAIIDECEITIQRLNTEWYKGKDLTVDLLRLDKIHPVVSGNKWFKLKENLQEAIRLGCDTIISFGGAYSNHLVATACAANMDGLKSIGLIRGLHGVQQFTPTLLACREYGMDLCFLTREEYLKKCDEAWLKNLQTKYPKAFIIPEGGANELGRSGAGTIAQFIPKDYTHICCSVGTATTFIGLRNVLPEHQTVMGFAPMKGGYYLKSEIERWLKENNGNWLLTDEFHFGGFAKSNDELIHFMNAFYEQNGIALDMVYTAKMMYGVQQWIDKNYFPPHANILCIHTGGLQGNVRVGKQLTY